MTVMKSNHQNVSDGMRCCLLQSVKRVIGVEIIENAVEDAKANAQLNGEFKRLASVLLLFSWLNRDSI